MNTIMVGDLVLMITQNCNLKCAHCFRGDAEDINLTDETIENTFLKISEVGRLTLTGGEPLYSPATLERITKVIEAIKKNNILIHQIQIITNGVNYSSSIEQVLEDLYGLARDKKSSCFLISSDKYHKSEISRLNLDDVFSENYSKYEKFSATLGIYFGYAYHSQITKLGKAENLEEATVIADINYYSNFKKFLLETQMFNTREKYAEILKIHTDGSVYCFMLSNDMIKEHTMFNIDEEGELQQLLENYYNNKYGFIAKPFTSMNLDNRARIRALKQNYRKN